MSSSCPIALIYRFKLLPFSETFIQNQAESLRDFQPHYLGLRSIPGITTDPKHTTILNPDNQLNGKLAELRFKLLGQTTDLPVKPALIHAHFADDGAIALPLAKRLGIPLVVTCHGFDVLSNRPDVKPSFSQRLYRSRKAQLQQQTKLFISVSDFLTQELIRQGFPAEKVVRHYIGIDTQKFRPNPAIEREPIVLFAGRLVEKKGCEFLLKAMADVQRVMPQVKLLIIGDGPRRSSLETQAQTTLANYEFLGAQPATIVQDWMARSRVFCVPSIRAACGDAETFGMVFAEAQAMGLPVVSFASGGIPESVADGVTGLLAPEGDGAALAGHLLRLLGEADLWARLSGAGPEFVRRNFDLAVQTRGLERLYHDRVCG
jgi:colanic acid/amylovoran biosynthesis glycosyltransferase